MKLVTTTEELKSLLPATGVGFVPTMGALHEGHLSLLRAARTESTFTVASIFVNPAQFNDRSDFEKYPRDPKTDLTLLEAAGCDLVFLPTEEEIYPDNYLSKEYDLGDFDHILEGAHRPGHFQGVARVMDRLLHLVRPQKLFLGRKDYQQCLVIEQLIKLLQLPVAVVRCETVREPSGLAMSSRNRRLSDEGRAKAAALFTALKQLYHTGKISDLAKAGFSKTEYFTLADPQTLAPVTDLTRSRVALAAAWIEGVRLIDNHSDNHEESYHP